MAAGARALRSSSSGPTRVPELVGIKVRRGSFGARRRGRYRDHILHLAPGRRVALRDDVVRRSFPDPEAPVPDRKRRFRKTHRFAPFPEWFCVARSLLVEVA
jgi:hypothetical protein